MTLASTRSQSEVRLPTPVPVCAALALCSHPRAKIPARAADMATIINAPMGISESNVMSKAPAQVTSALLAKRNQMQEMLISRLCKEYGSDPMRKAVITREVEKSSALKAGKLSPEGLRVLERAVSEAVRATRPGPMESLERPKPNTWSGGEMAAAVQKVANWTDVANHRASYYAVAEEAKQAVHDSRKVELRQMLAHQMSQERHKEAARKQMLREEASEVRVAVGKVAEPSRRPP